MGATTLTPEPLKPWKSRTTCCHKDPVERRPVHVEQRGDDSHGLALGAKVPGMGNLLVASASAWGRISPHVAWRSGRRGALGNQVTLQLGQDANHLPHGAAGGGLGVDVLGQGLKFDPLGAARPAA